MASKITTNNNNCQQITNQTLKTKECRGAPVTFTLLGLEIYFRVESTAL